MEVAPSGETMEALLKIIRNFCREWPDVPLSGRKKKMLQVIENELVSKNLLKPPSRDRAKSQPTCGNSKHTDKELELYITEDYLLKEKLTKNKSTLETLQELLDCIRSNFNFERATLKTDHGQCPQSSKAHKRKQVHPDVPLETCNKKVRPKREVKGQERKVSSPPTTSLTPPPHQPSAEDLPRSQIPRLFTLDSRRGLAVNSRHSLPSLDNITHPLPEYSSRYLASAAALDSRKSSVSRLNMSSCLNGTFYSLSDVTEFNAACMKATNTCQGGDFTSCVPGTAIPLKYVKTRPHVMKCRASLKSKSPERREICNHSSTHSKREMPQIVKRSKGKSRVSCSDTSVKINEAHKQCSVPNLDSNHTCQKISPDRRINIQSRSSVELKRAISKTMALPRVDFREQMCTNYETTCKKSFRNRYEKLPKVNTITSISPRTLTRAIASKNIQAFKNNTARPSLTDIHNRRSPSKPLEQTARKLFPKQVRRTTSLTDKHFNIERTEPSTVHCCSALNSSKRLLDICIKENITVLPIIDQENASLSSELDIVTNRQETALPRISSQSSLTSNDDLPSKLSRVLNSQNTIRELRRVNLESGMSHTSAKNIAKIERNSLWEWESNSRSRILKSHIFKNIVNSKNMISEFRPRGWSCLIPKAVPSQGTTTSISNSQFTDDSEAEESPINSSNSGLTTSSATTLISSSALTISDTESYVSYENNPDSRGASRQSKSYLRALPEQKTVIEALTNRYPRRMDETIRLLYRKKRLAPRFPKIPRESRPVSNPWGKVAAQTRDPFQTIAQHARDIQQELTATNNLQRSLLSNVATTKQRTWELHKTPQEGGRSKREKINYRRRKHHP